MAEKEKRKLDEQKILTDIAMAQDELNQLKKEYGLEEEEKGLKKVISTLFEKREEREKVLIKKKTYLWLGLLLGSFGAHRFYAKQYPTAILYLLLCWTGIALTMSLIDLMVVIPMKADENGQIYL